MFWLAEGPLSPSELIKGRYRPERDPTPESGPVLVHARDVQHERDVALVVRRIANDGERARALARTRALLSLAAHPAIPTVRDDFFEDEGRYVVVLDRVEGRPIQALLDERGGEGLPPKTVVDLVAKVAQAIGHMHAHEPPLVHGALDPSAVLVRADGSVAFSALALVAATPPDAAPSAPEVAAGAAPTTASDVYSLAAVARILAAGLSGRASALERALRRALSNDPARRPATAADLAAQLEAWVSEDLPAGTVTFMLTDVEGSTRLWERDPDGMSKAMAQHDLLVGDTVEAQGGRLIKTRGEGDSTFSVFRDASNAAAAAVTVQRALAGERWDTPSPLTVRIVLHTGEAELREGDYFGSTVNRAARLRAVAHGGQVVCSETTAELVRDRLPPEVTQRDLGVRRLKDLTRPERIVQLCHPALRENFPELATLDAVPNNLPIQLTTLIGREHETAAGLAILARARLLSVTGLGGIGKTRVALQVAAETLERFPDGAWLVELAPLADPGLVTHAVASSLGLGEEPERSVTDSLIAHCRARRLLIVLDTCEHLIAGCAPLVETVLRSCRDVRIVATSTEPLGVPGESVMPVPPLPVPDPDSSSPDALARAAAVELFVERARQAKPAFEPADGALRSIARICQQLDGIPLAIELAAARVKVLTLEQIAERLGDRFRLLAATTRTALPHQQTLRAAMDWSHDLLGEEERALLRRLSVFSGGCSLDAAEEVCASRSLERHDVLDRLALLIDKSLLIEEERAGEARYRMLQTVQLYARERLEASGEASEVRDRHLEWARALAERASREAAGPLQADWVARLTLDMDNMRGALEWSATQDRARNGLALACDLTWVWTTAGYWSEGRARLGRLSEVVADAPPTLVAAALYRTGLLAWHQADYASAEASYSRSLEMFRALGDSAQVGSVLNALGALAFRRGDLDGARRAYSEGLAIAREVGDTRTAAHALNNLGELAQRWGDSTSARSHYEEALDVARRLGEQRLIAAMLNNLGVLAEEDGDLERAEGLYEEALPIQRQLRARADISTSLGNLGEIARRRGDTARARALWQESLAIDRALGSPRSIAMTLTDLAVLALAEGELHETRSLGQEAVDRAREAEAQDVAALALSTLAEVADRLGDAAAARTLLGEALAAARVAGDEQIMVRLGQRIEDLGPE